MENEKIIKSAKTIDCILKVLQKIIFVGICLSLVFTVLTLVLGDSIIPAVTSINIGGWTFNINDNYVLDSENIKIYVAVCLATAAIFFAAGWYLCRVLRDILRPFRDGKPFEAGTSKKIVKLAWVSLIVGGIDRLREFVCTALETKVFLPALFNSDAVKSHSLNFTTDLAFIEVFLIILFISQIFKYGEALQVESDETL